MTNEQFEQARTTMPWADRWIKGPRGGILQIVDRFGREVPFDVMCGVLRLTTTRLARETAAAPTTPTTGASP